MQEAINHMNSGHSDANLIIAKFFGKLKDAKKAIIIKIEPKTLHLLVDNEIRVEAPFFNEVSKENIKTEIIALLNHANDNLENSSVAEVKEDISKEIQDHMDSLKTVTLATIGTDNFPCASYSPFASVDGKHYIYISKVADHYKNLEENPKLELLFLADESASKILTARKRVKFKATAKKLPRDVDNFDTILDQIQSKLGNTMKMIRTMGDFNLFEITLLDGRFVKGFGQAYSIEIQDNGFITKPIVFDAGVPHQIK